PGEVREMDVAQSEERELEAVGAAALAREVAGPVPPLERGVRMGSVGVAGRHRRRRGARRRAVPGQKQHAGEDSRDHSSASAEAGSTGAARRPGATPAATEAASTSTVAPSSGPAGTASATVHPKDWGLITSSRSQANAAPAARAASVPVAPQRNASTS